MVRKAKSKSKSSKQVGGFLPLILGSLLGGKKKVKRKQKGGIIARKDAFGRIITSPWVMS